MYIKQNCDICKSLINSAVEGCITGKFLYRVGHWATVHPICYCIRINKKIHTSKDQIGDESQWKTPAFKACWICGHTARRSQGIMRYGGCTCGWSHIACSITVMNIQRLYHCTICTHISATPAMINSWIGKTFNAAFVELNLKGGFKEDQPASAASSSSYTTAAGNSMKHFIENQWDTEDILEWHRLANKKGIYFPTALKQLCFELYNDPETTKKSVMTFLRKHNYNTQKMIDLGMTLPMMCKTHDDWEDALDQKYVHESQLTIPQINMTFIQWVLAGKASSAFLSKIQTVAVQKQLRYVDKAVAAAAEDSSDQINEDKE
jgi:hypothetical protein